MTIAQQYFSIKSQVKYGSYNYFTKLGKHVSALRKTWLSSKIDNKCPKVNEQMPAYNIYHT